MSQQGSAASTRAVLSEVPGTELRQLTATFDSFQEFVDRYSPWLSDSCIFVETLEELREGAPVRLEIKLAGKPALIRALGEVAWVRGPAEDGDEPPGVALNVTYLDPAGVRLIDSVFRLYTGQKSTPFSGEEVVETWELDVESLIDDAFPDQQQTEPVAGAAAAGPGPESPEESGKSIEEELELAVESIREEPAAESEEGPERPAVTIDSTTGFALVSPAGPEESPEELGPAESVAAELTEPIESAEPVRPQEPELLPELDQTLFEGEPPAPATGAPSPAVSETESETPDAPRVEAEPVAEEAAIGAGEDRGDEFDFGVVEPAAETGVLYADRPEAPPEVMEEEIEEEARPKASPESAREPPPTAAAPPAAARSYGQAMQSSSGKRRGLWLLAVPAAVAAGLALFVYFGQLGEQTPVAGMREGGPPRSAGAEVPPPAPMGTETPPAGPDTTFGDKTGTSPDGVGATSADADTPVSGAEPPSSGFDPPSSGGVAEGEPVVASAPPAAPAIPEETPPPAAEPPLDPAAVAEQVESVIRAWAAAWSDQRVDDYLASYAPDFSPPGMDRAAWERQRRARILGPASIVVKITEVEVETIGPDRARIRFYQDYETDTNHLFTWKTMELSRLPQGWKIVSQRSGR